MTDWVWYFLIPSASYLLYVVTGVALLKGASQALNALAGASILLLVVGIRNAWDLVVWFVLRKRSTPRRSDPSKRGASGRTGLGSPADGRDPADPVSTRHSSAAARSSLW